MKFVCCYCRKLLSEKEAVFKFETFVFNYNSQAIKVFHWNCGLKRNEDLKDFYKKKGAKK